MWDSEDLGGCKGRMRLVEVYPLHRCGLCHHGSPSGAPETDNLVRNLPSEMRQTAVILLESRRLGRRFTDPWALGGASVSLQQQEPQSPPWR